MLSNNYDLMSNPGLGLGWGIPTRHRERSPVPTEDEVKRNERRLSLFDKSSDDTAAKRLSTSSTNNTSPTSFTDGKGMLSPTPGRPDTAERASTPDSSKRLSTDSRTLLDSTPVDAKPVNQFRGKTGCERCDATNERMQRYA